MNKELQRKAFTYGAEQAPKIERLIGGENIDILDEMDYT